MEGKRKSRGVYCIFLSGLLWLFYTFGGNFENMYGRLRIVAEGKKIITGIIVIIFVVLLQELVFRKLLCDLLQKKFSINDNKGYYTIVITSGLLSGVCGSILAIWKVPAMGVFLFVIAQTLLGMIFAAEYLNKMSIFKIIVLHIWYFLGIFWSSFVYSDGSVKRTFENTVKFQIGEILLFVLLLLWIIYKQKKDGNVIEKSRLRKVVSTIVVSIFTYILVACIAELGFCENYLGVVSPITDKVSIDNLPEKYMIQHVNRIEYQQRNDCGGYAAAFVMRDAGIEVNGADTFIEFELVSDKGVFPAHLIKYLREKGMDATFYYGSVETLKARIAEDHPVIVKLYSKETATETDNNVQGHYNVAIGYDDENIYFADSIAVSDETVFD